MESRNNRVNKNIRSYQDDRPIRPSARGQYNMNFIDWNNEWERVSEVEIKIQNGEEIEDKQEEDRVRNYMNSVQQKLGVALNNFILVKNVDTGKECYICLKNFSTKKRIRQLPCKHMFCEDCLRPWLKTNYTCPTCKVKLKDDENDEEEVY
jgi:E3 ubiquitin-protein ligase RNF181